MLLTDWLKLSLYFYGACLFFVQFFSLDIKYYNNMKSSI